MLYSRWKLGNATILLIFSFLIALPANYDFTSLGILVWHNVTNSSAVCPHDFSSLLAPGGGWHQCWPRLSWHPGTVCCPCGDLDDDSDHGWVGAETLWHIWTLHPSSHAEFMLHTLLCRLCWSIFHLCLFRSKLPYQTVLEGGRGLTARCCFFTYFSKRVWPWSNYRAKVGKCCFHLWFL